MISKTYICFWCKNEFEKTFSYNCHFKSYDSKERHYCSQRQKVLQENNIKNKLIVVVSEKDFIKKFQEV